MLEYGEIPGEEQEELRDDMVFRLDPLKALEEEGPSKGRWALGNSGGDPMWASASSSPCDWFMAEE